MGKGRFLYVEGKNLFSLLPPMNRATLILCGKHAVLQFCYKNKCHFCEQAQDIHAFFDGAKASFLSFRVQAAFVFNWWLFFG